MGKRTWPWYPFVVFALSSALFPGFLFGTFFGVAPMSNLQLGIWYRAMIQAHGHAFLMGWGGSMIFGVALHFLPRLCGARLAWAGIIPATFWVFVGGTVLRVLGQPALALAEPLNINSVNTALRGAVLLGVFLQASGVFTILAVLIRTFCAGPPIRTRKGFWQIVLPLVTVALALVLAQAVWIGAAIEPVANERSPVLFSAAPNRAAIEMLLFGGVVAISLGMSARLFPLSFRMNHPSFPLLWLSSAFLFVGVVLTAARGLGHFAGGSNMALVEGFAALSFGTGQILGIPAVRVLHKRTPYPGKQRTYRLSRDPAGIGVVAAYGWGLVAALFLLLFAWTTFAGQSAKAGSISRDLALHAMGAGFMTLLILSVGWKMLPGFGGGTPGGRPWIWTAILLANLAVLLRLLPGTVALVAGGDAAGAIYFPSLATGGVAGLLAIVAFARALVISWRSA